MSKEIDLSTGHGTIKLINAEREENIKSCPFCNRKPRTYIGDSSNSDYDITGETYVFCMIGHTSALSLEEWNNRGGENVST